MCLYGVYKHVKIINPNQNKNVVVVDACIADEVQYLNDIGVITLSCCCSHGLAGQITEWEIGNVKRKGQYEPPHVLIDYSSIEIAKSEGYYPYPYYYFDGEHNNVWQMDLKTGCLNYVECIRWHKERGLPVKKELGIIA